MAQDQVYDNFPHSLTVFEAVFTMKLHFYA